MGFLPSTVLPSCHFFDRFGHQNSPVTSSACASVSVMESCFTKASANWDFKIVPLPGGCHRGGENKRHQGNRKVTVITKQVLLSSMGTYNRPSFLVVITSRYDLILRYHTVDGSEIRLRSCRFGS